MSGVVGRLIPAFDTVLSWCKSEGSTRDEERAVDGDGMFFLTGIGGGILSATAGDSGVRQQLLSVESRGMSTIDKSLLTKSAGADDYIK